MNILRATPMHEPAIRHLLANGRWVFQNSGDEDLRLWLDQGLALINEVQGQVKGFAAFQVESRPPTLPITAPDRTYLRALALAFGHAPAVDGVALLQMLLALLRQRREPTLAIVYGGERWLNELLPAVGFALTERIQSYRLEQVRRWKGPEIEPPAQVTLRPMQPTDIPAVAQLDAATFEPLWHFGSKALWELLFSTRAQVAVINETIVGYTAVVVNRHDSHLTRIGVHPQWQGQGLGRYLLDDVIRYVQSERVVTLSLNTQMSNERSQQLYLRFGFRPVKPVIPVHTQVVGAPTASAS